MRLATYICRCFVIVCGWVVILVAAAVRLPWQSLEELEITDLLLSCLTIVWLALTLVALGAYFYRGWRRVPSVPNRSAYILWLGFESLCTLTALGGLVLLLGRNSRDSIRQSRERVFRQDLFTMRAIISQYALDRQTLPRSLHDLVAAGYLKRIPVDPMTGRDDTWALKCSADSSHKGIVDIEGGASKQARQMSPRCD